MERKLMFMFGFLLGGFVGYVLGILSAPQSGAEMRDSIEERAIELRDKAEGAAERVTGGIRTPSANSLELDVETEPA